MNIYQARYNNAKRIAEQINDLIDKGYLIFNDTNELLTDKFIITDEKILLSWGSNCRFLYFLNDSEFDNGALDTIEKYNAKFQNWKIVNPDNVKKLELR